MTLTWMAKLASVTSSFCQVTSDRVETSLAEATAAMKKSDVARELFGEGFVDHFVATREWEWREFSKAITDWEFKRYFEII